MTPKTPWPDPRTSIATAILSILSGWATAVIATDLITGWWESDMLFCVAVAFLTAISAAALIAGLIGLLLRRRASRLLIIVGAVVALLIFSSLFVAGAKLPPVVYAIPVLPLATIACALLPATARWGRPVRDGTTAQSEILELGHRGVVVHQLDPARAAEVDERHRRLTDAGNLLDAAEAVLVVVDPIAGFEHQ